MTLYKFNTEITFKRSLVKKVSQISQLQSVQYDQFGTF